MRVVLIRNTLGLAQACQTVNPSEQADPCILRWPEHSVTDGTARLEAPLAAGARFGVLVMSVSHLEGHDTHLHMQWHRAASDRMEALCVGWAMVLPAASVRPAFVVSDVPGAPVSVATRVYSDPHAALAWLRLGLRQAQRLACSLPISARRS